MLPAMPLSLDITCFEQKSLQKKQTFSEELYTKTSSWYKNSLQPIRTGIAPGYPKNCAIFGTGATQTDSLRTWPAVLFCSN
jgi:hypothetical protein